MTDTESSSDEQTRRENERVTEDDVVVQTPNGERYKSHLINATGLPREVVEERTND
ncbi:MAG: hypothetical protein ACOCZD_02745 [Haloferacaceae archaeon]